MFKSCTYCSKAHKTTEICPNKPVRVKENNAINRFRSGSAWRKKSLEIRKIDLFLCLVCKSKGRYHFKDLEVHHIVPIQKKWDLRLENDNLITLCSVCHTEAECNEISVEFLRSLIKNRNEVVN